MSPTYFSIIGAIIAGLVAAGIFAVLARLTTLNVLNMVSYLSTLYSPRPNLAVGWVLHFVLGCIFALIYIGLWSWGLKTSDFYLYGLIGGIVHWLIAGFLMAGAPAVHAGIREGLLPAPGLYAGNIMGAWGFLAGLVSHVIFGVSVVYFYQFFAYLR